MHASPQALTPREAAEVLRLTREQVGRLIESRELAVVEVQGRPCPKVEAVRRMRAKLDRRRRRVLAALERDLPPTRRTVH